MNRAVGLVDDYPALVASAVAGLVIGALVHVFGSVPDAQVDQINSLAAWIVPLVITMAGGLFTHRRVTTVSRDERGLSAPAHPTDVGTDEITEDDPSDIAGDAGDLPGVTG